MNSNELEQSPIRGVLDLQVNDGGVFNGRISDGEDDMVAGDRVALDVDSTGKLPAFVAAAVGDEEFGVIIRTVMQGTFKAGDRIQVASSYRGPVQYHKAEAAIKPGWPVEMIANGNVQHLTTGSQLGIALDYIAAGGLGRIILAHVDAA